MILHYSTCRSRIIRQEQRDIPSPVVPLLLLIIIIINTMPIVITEDVHRGREDRNPTPAYDFAPSPKLYQAYLRAWYHHDDMARHDRDNNPSDSDLSEAHIAAWMMTSSTSASTAPSSSTTDGQGKE